jgi:hypothetical protein
MAGTCECGNEISGSIKCGVFLDQLKSVSFSRRTLLHGVDEYVREETNFREYDTVDLKHDLKFGW